MNESNVRNVRALRQATQAPSQQPATDGLMQSLGLLWRSKLMVLAIAMLPLLYSVFYVTVMAVPQYMARTQLLLNVQVNEIADVASAVSGVSTEGSAINTELEVMRSRRLIGELVDRLDLTSDPLFNESLRAPGGADRFVGMLRGLLGGSEPREWSETETRERAINAARRAVATVARRGTYILEVRVTTADRRTSALLANTLAQIYIEDQINTKFESTEYAVNWLSERVTELERELYTKEDAVKALRAQTELINEDSLNALTLRSKDLRDRAVRLDDLVQTQQARAQTLREIAGADDAARAVRVTNDPTLRRLLDSDAADDAGSGAEFRARLAALIAAAEREAQRVALQRDALQGSLAQIEEEVAAQSRDLTTLNQMLRETDATRVLYETFLARLKEASLQIGFQQADSRIMEDARPGRLVAPQPATLYPMALIMGLILGSAVVLLMHYLRHGVKTISDLERLTNLPVLGQVPQMPIRHREDLIRYLIDNPTSGPVEALRNLRTSLLLSNTDKPPQVILSTSSVPGEGKTTLAVALAGSLTGVGKTVLLIGADTRRQTITNYFPKLPESGLFEVISGQSAFDDAVVRDETLGVDLITGRSSEVNPANMFSSEAFVAFLSQMRGQYDYIVMDSPPVLLVPDARILGQYADAVIMSVQWNKTPTGQVKEALRQLTSIGVAVTGVVLSRVNSRKMQQYSQDGSYGYYSTYKNGYYG